MLVSEHLKCKALYVVYSTRCNFSQILRLWKSSWQLMLHLKVHTPSKSLPSFSCTVGYIVRSNSLSPNMQKYPAPPACLTVFYNNHRGVNISILHWHSDTSHTLHLPDAHFIHIKTFFRSWLNWIQIILPFKLPGPDRLPFLTVITTFLSN